MDVGLQAKRRAVIFLAVAGAILWFPVIQVFFGHPPGFLRNLGFLSAPLGTPLAWILGIAVAVAYIRYAIRIPVVAKYWRELSFLKLLAIFVAVPAAIVEEAFFRRVIMDVVMAEGGGSLVQIASSAVIFGVAHGIWGVVTGRMVVGVGVVVVTGIVGAALAVVYLIGERSLAPVIVSHFLITASIQPGITFAAFGGRMRLPMMRPS